MRRMTWIGRRALQAFAILLVVAGFYLLVDGSYGVAGQDIAPLFTSIIELVAGSVLIWSGSASIAASRAVAQSLKNEKILPERANRPAQENSPRNI